MSVGAQAAGEAPEVGLDEQREPRADAGDEADLGAPEPLLRIERR